MPYPTELKPDGIDTMSALKAERHQDLVGAGSGIPLNGLQGGAPVHPEERPLQRKPELANMRQVTLRD